MRLVVLAVWHSPEKSRNRFVEHLAGFRLENDLQIGDFPHLPSGNLTFCYGKSPFLMGKLTISMAIFNSKPLNYQRVCFFFFQLHLFKFLRPLIPPDFVDFLGWFDRWLSDQLAILAWSWPNSTFIHIAEIILLLLLLFTSSTAQGGGGSFRLGNHYRGAWLGCCESQMAERIHWWTERWLELFFFGMVTMVAVVTWSVASPTTAGCSVV